MRIKAIHSQYRYDFKATMECEHCGRTAELGTGYDDWNYHARVIPAMICKGCGKNRAGDTRETMTVPKDIGVEEI